MAFQAESGRNTGTFLPSALDRSIEKHADLIALKAEGGRGRSYTYREIGQMIDRLAVGLIGNDMLPIPEIGILSENRPEWSVAYFAILKAGGTVVPIDANLKENEIVRIIEHAGLKSIFVSGRFEQMVDGFDSITTVISFEETSSRGWREIMADEETPVPVPTDVPVAVLIYTSGTTGTPKAVELTHRNLLSNYEGIIDACTLTSDDNAYSVLPLHHTFEAMIGMITPLLCGMTIVYSRSLKSKEIIEDIRGNEITIMTAVPLLYEKMYLSIRRGIEAAPAGKRLAFNLLLNMSRTGWKLGLRLGRALFAPLREKVGLGSVRLFVSGGAAIPPRIVAFFNYLGIDFIQGYGLTECSPVVSVNRIATIQFGSVGPPLFNVETRIDNPGSDGIGEVLVRGENVTPGYRDNPEETAKLIRDGWLYTGDLGTLRNGHLWITGRCKSLIVSAAGKNIYPEELEERLLESAAIAEAVVFGRPKENRQGEEVRAIVVPDLDQLKESHGIDPHFPNTTRVHEIIEKELGVFNQKVADYKRITGWEIRFEELEKTSTKKVKRFLYK